MNDKKIFLNVFDKDKNDNLIAKMLFFFPLVNDLLKEVKMLEHVLDDYKISSLRVWFPSFLST